MHARMSYPAMILPGAKDGIRALLTATQQGGVPEAVLELIHLRVSQINGCSYCVDSGARSARKIGETDERLFAVAAWRESPYFTDAERAALALAEAATRLADQADPVPDAIWDEAARHYDEHGLAALILMIATTNFFNRLYTTTRQVDDGAIVCAQAVARQAEVVYQAGDRRPRRSGERPPAQVDRRWSRCMLRLTR